MPKDGHNAGLRQGQCVVGLICLLGLLSSCIPANKKKLLGLLDLFETSDSKWLNLRKHLQIQLETPRFFDSRGCNDRGEAHERASTTNGSTSLTYMTESRHCNPCDNHQDTWYNKAVKKFPLHTLLAISPSLHVHTHHIIYIYHISYNLFSICMHVCKYVHLCAMVHVVLRI